MKTINRALATALFSVAAIGLSTSAVMAEGGYKHHGKKYEHKMENVDTNGDGMLSKEEMQAAHEKRLDEMFANFDEDEDGLLSKKELMEGRKDMRHRVKERMKNMREKSGGMGKGMNGMGNGATDSDAE